tara:strand:- start:513 stop:1178 length:666 start_codon:yes stop_codon:yes gene_type:complete
MPQSGFTPIQLYRSSTASATPNPSDLQDGELALNTNDGKLFYKDSSGNLGTLATSSGSSGSVTSVQVDGGTTGLSYSGGPITTSGTITTAGTLVTANGGTGLTAIGTAGQVLTVNSGATALEYATPDSGFPQPQLVSGNTTATSAQFLVASAGSITITLPSGPSAGDFVVIKDGTGAAATTNFTVARNGSNIASSATDLTFDKNFAEITMTYVDATIGWSV